MGKWKRGLPPGKYYPGMENDYEVRFTVGGLIWHRRKVKRRRISMATNNNNGTIIMRIKGVPAQPGTPETDADPANPNAPQYSAVVAARELVVQRAAKPLFGIPTARRATVIKCAAIRVGEVTLSKEPPARHVHLMRELDRILDGADCRFDVEQGFLTEDGKFVDRIEAMKIATEAKQTFIRPPYNRELFSENLW